MELGTAWHEGRDKVILNPNPGAFGLWVEQLIAESTGKEGKGLVPVPRRVAGRGLTASPQQSTLEEHRRQSAQSSIASSARRRSRER